MTPILGIFASQQTRQFQNSYESIATTTLSSSAATITFSSIPSTYTHLQVRCLLKATNAGSTNETWKITLNSDTAANYSYHEVYGNGTSAAALSGVSVAFMNSYGVPSSGFISIFAGSVIDILDYANTSKYKTIRALGGYNSNASTDSIDLASGNWRNTAAITSITFTPSSGSWAQYSSFALYGIKG